MIQDAWGWCTGMTQRDGTRREVGGGYRMGNTCTPMADSYGQIGTLIGPSLTYVVMAQLGAGSVTASWPSRTR